MCYAITDSLVQDLGQGWIRFKSEGLNDLFTLRVKGVISSPLFYHSNTSRLVGTLHGE